MLLETYKGNNLWKNIYETPIVYYRRNKISERKTKTRPFKGEYRLHCLGRKIHYFNKQKYKFKWFMWRGQITQNKWFTSKNLYNLTWHGW